MFGRRFESAHLHEKKVHIITVNLFFVETSLNPCHFVTSPFRGMPTTPSSGRASPLLQLSFESLADADDAALMRRILVQIQAIRKFYLHLLSQGGFA